MNYFMRSSENFRHLMSAPLPCRLRLKDPFVILGSLTRQWVPVTLGRGDLMADLLLLLLHRANGTCISSSHIYRKNPLLKMLVLRGGGGFCFLLLQ